MKWRDLKRTVLRGEKKNQYQKVTAGRLHSHNSQNDKTTEMENSERFNRDKDESGVWKLEG